MSYPLNTRRLETGEELGAGPAGGRFVAVDD
jgi:hypothetical protein